MPAVAEKEEEEEVVEEEERLFVDGEGGGGPEAKKYSKQKYNFAVKSIRRSISWWSTYEHCAHAL